jgi:lysophospholipase L1-like esterase
MPQPAPRPTGTRLRAVAVNVGLALASLLVLLLALEGGLRLAARFSGPELRTTELADYGEYDPLLAWRKRPGTRLLFTRREYRVPLEINSLGLRDPERGYRAAPGVRRILALGDSYVEGYTVPLESTVTQQMEQRLRHRGCRMDVINGGTTGYSTDQEYLFYGSEGVRYAPSVVLLFFCLNDVYYNDSQWYYARVSKPVFVYRNGQLVLWKYPVPEPKPTPTEPRPEARSAESLLSSSAVYGWLRARLWLRAPDLYYRLGQLGLWPARRSGGGKRPEYRVLETGPEARAKVEGCWEKTNGLLALLANDVRAQGRKLAVVYIPSRMEVDDRAWRPTLRRFEMEEAQSDRRLVYEQLRQICERLSVPLLDLTPNLRAVERGFLGGPYYPDDGHWNARGHSVAAEAVVTFLSSQNWLDDCGASDSTR